jgi:hypothetical protein
MLGEWHVLRCPMLNDLPHLACNAQEDQQAYQDSSA